MRKFKVFEDNGGGLSLFVFDTEYCLASGNEKVVYANIGYEFMPGQLLKDLKALKDGDDPVNWEGDFETQPGNELWTDQEYYENFIDGIGYETVCDNNGIYYNLMSANAWNEFKESPQAVSTMIADSYSWNDDLNRQLCKLAGMEKEYDQADSETFEDVVFRAAEKLNVEII